jgi:hypothetical protein
VDHNGYQLNVGLSKIIIHLREDPCLIWSLLVDLNLLQSDLVTVVTSGTFKKEREVLLQRFRALVHAGIDLSSALDLFKIECVVVADV